MNAHSSNPATIGFLARVLGAILVLGLVAANLGTVDVNLIVLSSPVPVAVLVAAPAVAGAVAALRWNAAQIAAKRDRRERRRDLDRLLRRRTSVPVRH